jgi:hypothetical protein
MKKDNKREDPALKTLRAQKNLVIDMSQLVEDQREGLRLKHNLGQNNIVIPDDVNIAGVSRVWLEQFLSYRSIVDIDYLRLIVVYLAINVDTLLTRLRYLSKELPDRHKALAFHPPRVVELWFDLRLSAGTSKVKWRDFARCFGEQEKLLADLILSSHETLVQLNQESTFQAVAGVLRKITTGEIVPQQFAVEKEHSPEFMEKQNKLLSLADQLVSRYGSRAGVSKALGGYADLLYDVKRGHVGIPRMDELILAAQRLLVHPPNIPVAHSLPLSGTSVLDQFGGETLSDGTKYVLTASSFKQLEIESAQQLATELGFQLSKTRALLNMASQIKDLSARKTIKRLLSRNVEELYLALYLFSQDFPNNALELMESQSRFFQQLESGQGKLMTAAQTGSRASSRTKKGE